MRSDIISILLGFLFVVFVISTSNGQKNRPVLVEYDQVTCGAERLMEYIDLIKDTKIAVVANQSSLVKNSHLVDTLTQLKIKIDKIFCPEHGFRGNEDAGKLIRDNIDFKTGIPVISLYGSHKKPTKEDLQDIDIVLFDLQDVGVRFYTYISTMTYVMEACAENNIPIIILDRPNPNGFYVDGPVLEPEFKSFVGLHPVPIVYGMTIGEYAMMVANEGWINCADKLDLRVISMAGYKRNMIVKLKVKPSPNLPNWQSVYLYPTLCLFEGTIMSVGRGTDTPFQIYGHPKFFLGSYVFIPESKEGASNPKYKGEHCYGANITGFAENYKRNKHPFVLSYLIGTYETMVDSSGFFTAYFNKLAGNNELKKQIKEGLKEKEIRRSWSDDLDKFKKMREKYLIYD